MTHIDIGNWQLEYENRQRIHYAKTETRDLSQSSEIKQASEIIKIEIDEEKYKLASPLSLKWKRVRTTCNIKFAIFHIHFTEETSAI